MQMICLKKSILLCIFLLFLLTTNAQVTIGSSQKPLEGALLQLKENENIDVNSFRGLGMPRVELEAIEKLDPCIPSDELVEGDKNIHVGLMVYNMTDKPPIGLCPGLHVWNGDKWIRLHGTCGIDPSLINAPNCYIVQPGGVSEEIPIAKAYLVSEERSDLTALNRSDKVSLEILWQDTENLISNMDFVDGDKGILTKFKVTSNSGKSGNAVVAIHIGPNGNKENDPICWSWHIWVTDYDPENGGTTYTHNNGEKDYTFMDRNLGATTTSNSDPSSMGMTYQWGRKDPFPANLEFGDEPDFRVIYNAGNAEIYEIDELYTESTGTGIQHYEVTELKNLGKSILNPMIYYYAKADDNDTNDTTADWFTTDDTGASGDNDLWGGISGGKSPFDPCPAGWKVPAMSSATKSPWTFESSGWGGGGVTIGSTGFTMTGLGFYPYGFPRFPRPVISCVGIPCVGQNYVGGAFVASAFWNSERGAYWTATASTNNLAARTSGIIGAGSPQPTFTNLDFSKAGGAYVRCVRE